MPDGYASHLPVLCYFASKFAGPVIEFGMGYYSTPILHGICNDIVVSADSDIEWVNKFTYLSTSKHIVTHVGDWQLFDGGKQYCKAWNVALIDHRPKRRRSVDIALLANSTKFIIAHDSQSTAYGYEQIFPKFRYKREFSTFGPTTMVLSNFEDIPNII